MGSKDSQNTGFEPTSASLPLGLLLVLLKGMCSSTPNKHKGIKSMQFKNNDTMVSFRIPTDVDARMDWISDQKWTDKSSIYRDAVRKYLKENQDLFSEEYINLNQHLQPNF